MLPSLVLFLAGWRRSGNYSYQANMKATCCPLYTIRLAVERLVALTVFPRSIVLTPRRSFRETKELKQKRKSMQHFLETGQRPDERKRASADPIAMSVSTSAASVAPGASTPSPGLTSPKRARSLPPVFFFP
jgi:hypothetical protein